jgi:hypothetical protein
LKSDCTRANSRMSFSQGTSSWQYLIFAGISN